MIYSKTLHLTICASFCLVLFSLNADCHPTFYNVGTPRNRSCFAKAPVKIFSWHIHVVYNDKQEKIKKQALMLLEKFKETFQSELGAPCTGLFHQNRLCVFEPEQAAGPFPVADWSIFVPVDHFASKVPWFMQNRVSNGISLDVLVHPNSGCEIEDHSWWSMWGGEKWRLNDDALSYDKPYPWK